MVGKKICLKGLKVIPYGRFLDLCVDVQPLDAGVKDPLCGFEYNENWDLVPTSEPVYCPGSYDFSLVP